MLNECIRVVPSMCLAQFKQLFQDNQSLLMISEHKINLIPVMTNRSFYMNNRFETNLSALEELGSCSQVKTSYYLCIDCAKVQHCPNQNHV